MLFTSSNLWIIHHSWNSNSLTSHAEKKNFKEYNLQIASKIDELLALNILLIKWRLSLEFGECLEGFSSFKTWKHFPCLKFVMSTMCKLLIPYELNISKFCKSQNLESFVLDQKFYSLFSASKNFKKKLFLLVSLGENLGYEICNWYGYLDICYNFSSKEL